jgi:hypothetical protein
MAWASGVQVIEDEPAMLRPRVRRYSENQPLFWLSPRDPFRIGDGPHIGIFGESGSGKTVAGNTIALGYLKAGWGGCVCCYKEDETRRWLRMAEAAGVPVIVINPDNDYTLNLAAWEMERPGRGSGSAENLADLLMSIAEFISPGGRRQVQDQHWTDGARRGIRNSFEALRAADMPVTMRNLQRVIAGIPVRNRMTHALIWPEGSLLREALQRARQRGIDTSLLESYYIDELARAGQEEHTGSVLSSITHMLDYLVSGVVAHLFFNDNPTIRPDMSKRGVVYILDLPVLEYGNVGRIGQIAFRTVWIKEMMRRQGLESLYDTWAFLYMDESQQFFSPQLDNLFLEAARSSCISACYLTQTISAWYAAAEAAHAHDQVHAAMSNLGLKIFMRNSGDTNTYASNLISKGIQIRYSGGSSENETRNVGVNSGYSGSSGSGGGGPHSSSSFNFGTSRGFSASYGANFSWRQEKDALVDESVFTNLQVGQALVFRSGKRFALTGRPYTWVQFQPWEQALARGARRGRAWR